MYNTIVKNETAEEKATRIFNVYKRDLTRSVEQHGRVRYNCIEYLCSFPKIDPVKMGAALMLDGYKVIFDDSSISTTKNAQKRHHVESATGLNPMCFDCAKRCHGCDGTTNKAWTGCIYKTVEG